MQCSPGSEGVHRAAASYRLSMYWGTLLQSVPAPEAALDEDEPPPDDDAETPPSPPAPVVGSAPPPEVAPAASFEGSLTSLPQPKTRDKTRTHTRWSRGSKRIQWSLRIGWRARKDPREKRTNRWFLQ